ncbi:MAG: hypothetical protein ACRDTS_03175 [Mycobacterium sp.]
MTIKFAATPLGNRRVTVARADSGVTDVRQAPGHVLHKLRRWAESFGSFPAHGSLAVGDERLRSTSAHCTTASNCSQQVCPGSVLAVGDDLLVRAAREAARFRGALAERPVAPRVDREALRAAFGGSLPAGPTPAGEVLRELLRAAEPGVVATAGPRFFGFVTGGRLRLRPPPTCWPPAGISARSRRCSRLPPRRRRSVPAVG